VANRQLQTKTAIVIWYKYLSHWFIIYNDNDLCVFAECTAESTFF